MSEVSARLTTPLSSVGIKLTFNDPHTLKFFILCVYLRFLQLLLVLTDYPKDMWDFTFLKIPVLL